MTDLIDRRVLLSDIEKEIEFFSSSPGNHSYFDYAKKNGLIIARHVIERQSAIEAQPVRHGRWINDTFCSECKRFPVPAGVSIGEQVLTKYFSWCPHCGAKLDADHIADSSKKVEGGSDND